MSRATLSLVGALALAGCAATAPQKVEVPVPIPCHVKVPDRPVWATDTLPPGAGLYDKVKALLAERLQRISYETELEAAAKSCQ